MLPVPQDRMSGRRSSSIVSRTLLGRRASVYVTGNHQDPAKVEYLTIFFFKILLNYFIYQRKPIMTKLITMCNKIQCVVDKIIYARTFIYLTRLGKSLMFYVTINILQIKYLNVFPFVCITTALRLFNYRNELRAKFY